MILGLILSTLMLCNPLSAVTQNVQSNVIKGLYGDLYAQETFHEYVDRSDKFACYSYDLNTNELSFEDEFNCVDITDYSEFLHSLYQDYAFENVVYGGNNYVYIFVGYKDKNLIYDGHYINTWVRFATYNTNNINSIELFNINGYSSITPYSNVQSMVGNNYYTFNGFRYDNWFGTYYGNNNGFNLSTTVVFNQGYMPNMMFDTLFGFETLVDGNQQIVDFKYNFYHFDINQVKLQEYYNNGYSDGKTDGIAYGYHQALEELGRNTTFDALFGAIADTPIRMLYGLFNFDLFGISMLAVVLTTLTAIILFHIIKKFIK